MAIFDIIWTCVASTLVLTFVALLTFLTVKLGIISFSIIIDAVRIAKGIETSEGKEIHVQTSTDTYNLEKYYFKLQNIERKIEEPIIESKMYSSYMKFTDNITKTVNEKYYPIRAFMQLFKK